jgi:3',5'-cyclic AMP phosphodiesterase CpdA
MRRRYLLAFLASGAAAAALFAALSRAESGGVPSYAADIAPDAPPVFVLYGDSRRTLTREFWRRDYETERLLVVDAIAREAPAFVVNTGDLVADGSSPAEWRRFHRDNTPIWDRRIPYFPGLGNHEYFGDRELGLRNYFAFFPALHGRKWYEIRFRSVLIAMLDSNFGRIERWEVEAQDRWLSDLLAAAEKDASVRHVIVCCHHAPYTNALIHGDDRDVQEHFVKRLTPKVKAFVSGHVHSYERFAKGSVQFVVSGGGGAPTASVEVEAPRHPDAFKGPAYRGFHYLRLALDGEKLSCDVIMLQDDRSWKRVDGFDCP